MKTKELIAGESLTGERALFSKQNIEVRDCTFSDGESPLKECRDVEVINCDFRWRYPLWYCRDVHLIGGTWNEDVRAGIWYTDNITIEGCHMESPKGIRRCHGVTILNTEIIKAPETLWDCSDIRVEHVTAEGAYFAKQVDRMVADHLTLNGPYSFDGAKNVEIHNSTLISKDAFWNSENITVYDSYISGEYLGWNAKNLTLINCTVESLQGFCYIENLVMKNCRCKNTTLAFEYSTVDLDIVGAVDSILNPKAGVIRVGSVGELMIEPDRVVPENTRITLTGSK